MKVFQFLFFLGITTALIYFLNQPYEGIPALGKLLSPQQGFWQNGESEDISLPESLELEGLKEQVTISFDQLLIPHIEAKNKEDLHFAQGYVTAYHRLWQMDFYSRVVFGRLSEVIGRRALDYDRLQRRKGLKDMTLKFHEKLMADPEMNRIIRAYTAGVNAYISGLSPADHPIEYKLLGYEPELWSTQKTAMAYALLSNTLSRGESDLENTNARELLGKDMFDLLFPEQVGNISPVIPSDTKWDFDPLKAHKPEIKFPSIITKKTIPNQDPLNGSNNFAVDGTKSKSGNVILANEPDLQLTLPSIWYASHLSGPDLNVMGVTVPGTPVILIGFNDSIAWGVTNSPRDQADWYSVTFKDETRKEYLYNNQWFKTEQKLETFKIKGEEPFVDTMIYVHQGPVVYDRNFYGDNAKRNYAMRWIAHDVASTFHAMYNINRSSNYNEFQEAIKDFSGPPQNIIYGSTSGDIALNLPGKFPVKWPEQGKFLMDGSNPDSEWSQYIPFEHRLTRFNHPDGYLSSANQHPVDDSYPYYVYASRYEYNRNRRINDRLQVMSDVTPADMMKLQNDNYNYQASESLPIMLDQLDSVTRYSDPTAVQLEEWDYFNETDLVAPSIYQLWWNELYASIWDEFDTITYNVDRPNKYVTIDLMSQDSSWAFYDRLETSNLETLTDLVRDSYVFAKDSLRSWTEANGDAEWSKFKGTEINHLISQFSPFNVTDVNIGGYGGIVNAASKYNGPSWRMVVELDPDGVRAYGIYPGSQSGNPGNPTYAHMINDWAVGNYHELDFGGNRLTDQEIKLTTNLHPKDK